MRLANIRSSNTLTSHLRHFVRLNVLIITRGESGDQQGNYYETRCEEFRAAIERTRESKIRLTNV